MARPVKFPRSASDRSTRTDWSRWADRGWQRLTQGTDYPQDPGRALRAIRAWGTRHGYSVSGQVSGPDSIDVRISARTH